MFGTIVIGLDGSASAKNALQVAVMLAKAEGSKVALCSVVDPLPKFGGLPPSAAGAALTAAEDDARRILDDASQTLTAAEIEHESAVVLGDPVREICRFAARTHAGAIVVGSRGLSGLKRLLVGSVAEGVLRSASVPVVIVHREE